MLLAHGGREQGYALHLLGGKPAFDVRVNGKVTRVTGNRKVNGRTKLTATLDAKAITLSVNDEQVATRPSPGLIPVQPKDDLSVGKDVLSAAGDYDAPNPFDGTIHSFKVAPSTAPAAPEPLSPPYHRVWSSRRRLPIIRWNEPRLHSEAHPVRSGLVGSTCPAGCRRSPHRNSG